MAGEINYKQKYLELKQKFKDSVDTSFRLGYEQGQNDAQMQQMQEAQAQQAAMEQAQAAGQGQPGQPGQEGGAPGEQPPTEGAAQSGQPAGSELDQHITQLESMLGKSELTGEDIQELKKSISALKQGVELKKSDIAIESIVKSLKKSQTIKPMRESAVHNLNPTAKAALTMQEKIVGDIMKTWAAEESKAPSSITAILANEGLKKE
jgi:hypothetical protein